MTGYVTATIKVGEPRRSEWTNVGVLVFDAAAEGQPLVASRYTTDWERVARRAELGDWATPAHIEQSVMSFAKGFRTYEDVERAQDSTGHAMSCVQCHKQGASIRMDPTEIADSFYHMLVYEPGREAA